MSKNNDHKYEFVSTFEEVDFERIVREAPQSTPFILVEARDRITHKPIRWALFVHINVLSDSSLEASAYERSGEYFIKGYLLGSEEDADSIVTPVWGVEGEEEGSLFTPYRAVSGHGKFPGYIKQQIEQIRLKLNKKDTLTTVTYV